MLELMRVDVERDARACMTELARRANGVDTCSDQVTRKRVPEIVEPELGQSSLLRPAASAALSRPRFATLFRLSGVPVAVAKT